MIDLDRGVMCKPHPKGFHVYMYLDDPGVFMTAHGSPLPARIAREAGYDVEVLEKQRKIAQELAKRRKDLEKELALDEAAETVIREAKNYKLVSAGSGMARIVTKTGEAVTPVALPKAEAEALFQELIGGKEKSNGGEAA